jgi:chromosome segregation ATPase
MPQVNLQHGLILEHQQAFQDYKGQTASKLKELDDLQERVSRLTLEKGNFREEIDKYAKMLEHEQSTKSEDFKKVDALQGQLESLVDSKKQLLAEVDGLQKTIGDLQEKMQSAEQQLTDRFTTELREKTELLAEETAKVTNLSGLISNLRTQESNVKMEMSKLSAESKLINDKYNRMASEHSQVFSVSRHVDKLSTMANNGDRRAMSRTRRSKL